MSGHMGVARLAAALSVAATCLLALASSVSAQARLVPVDVILSSNSNANSKAAVVDRNDTTFWQSDACFPTGYHSRPATNIMLSICSTAGACSASSGSSSLGNAVDASTYTSASIALQAGGAGAFFAAALPSGPYNLRRISVRGWFTANATVSVFIVGSAGQRHLVTTLTSPANDFAWVHVANPGTWPAAASLRVESAARFWLTELAALHVPCFEQAAVDFGEVASIGSIRVRHWSGSAISSQLLSSTDGMAFTPLASLDPNTLGPVTIALAQPVMARYIAVMHVVKEADWAKVNVWSIDANASVASPPPSPPPSPSPPSPLPPSSPPPESAWNPRAGTVTALTFGGAARVSSNSNPQVLAALTDGVDSTQWQSDACYPTGYVGRPSMNALLWACNTTGVCTASSGSQDLRSATDTSVYTGASIAVQPAAGGQPALAFFQAPVAAVGGGPAVARRVSVKGGYASNGTVGVYLLQSTGQRVLVASLNSSAHQWQWVHVAGSWPDVVGVRVEGAAGFTLTELAVNVGSCMEEAVVDMGAVREVGVLRVRFWSPDALSSTLYVSADGQAWTMIQVFDPNTLPAVELILPELIYVRYLRLVHAVKEDADWRKVYVWGLDAYDRHGRWGPPPEPVPHPLSLRAFMGVNGIWGWGFNQFSNSLHAQGKGPDMYTAVASHGRNYHGMNWDVKSPLNNPKYDTMRTTGTDGQWWLNWDREYAGWKAAGMRVDASFQFVAEDFPPASWGANATDAAYRLGFAFGAHFGPGRAPANVSLAAVEVGNEPWDYNATFYAKVLRGFASGIKAADPTFPVLPCALQADNPYVESDSSGNFVGARIEPDVAPLLDALNLHIYSFYRMLNGTRIYVHPEHPGSYFNGLNNMLAWRNHNMPGKPVWVTEWGWDANLPGTPCGSSECVSQHAQAVYGIRGLMILARKGVALAHWFFYANDDGCDSLFCRSGLRGSNSTGFPVLPVFTAFEALLQRAGSAAFAGVAAERPDLYAYLLGPPGSGPAAATHLLAWRPVEAGQGPEDDAAVVAKLRLATPRLPAAAWAVNGLGAQPAPLPSVGGDGAWSVSVSATPLLVQLQ